MLSGLSTSNKKWLAKHLYEDVEREEIEKDRKKEYEAVFMALSQVKKLREGTLETHDIKELLNED